MKLIDADALLTTMKVNCPMENDLDSFKAGMRAVLERIFNAPTVDAVPVVMCMDCKWFDISEPSGTVEPIGHKCKRRRIFVDSDDFCKRGERNTNGNC